MVHEVENDIFPSALDNTVPTPHKIELQACYSAWIRRKYFMIILVENGYYPIQSLGVDAAISSLRHERVFGDHYLLVQIMSFL